MTGVRFPTVSCAFKACLFQGKTYTELKAHILKDHLALIRHTAGRQAHDCEYAFYTAAISAHEQTSIPSIGYSIDRRTFELTIQSYNDAATRSLMCFICGQIKPTTHGARSLITMKKKGWLVACHYMC